MVFLYNRDITYNLFWAIGLPTVKTGSHQRIKRISKGEHTGEVPLQEWQKCFAHLIDTWRGLFNSYGRPWSNWKLVFNLYITIQAFHQKQSVPKCGALFEWGYTERRWPWIWSWSRWGNACNHVCVRTKLEEELHIRTVSTGRSLQSVLSFVGHNSAPEQRERH